MSVWGAWDLGRLETVSTAGRLMNPIPAKLSKKDWSLVLICLIQRLPIKAEQANALDEKEGFAKFVSVQGHHNLIFREEEREMAKFCKKQNIAMTPYSALAGGRLVKRSGEISKRLQEDSYVHLKYDATAKQDGIILDRVASLLTNTACL